MPGFEFMMSAKNTVFCGRSNICNYDQMYYDSSVDQCFDCMHGCEICEDNQSCNKCSEGFEFMTNE